MKKLFLPIIGAFLFIVITGLLAKEYRVKNQETLLVGGAPSIANSMLVGDAEVEVKYANSKSERANGLSNVESLPENSGLLFIFEEPQTQPSFWMKDMNFPIDIIWISADKVVQIDYDVPPPEPNTPDNELTVYSPKQPVDYVLEVNGGFSSKNNIEVGNSVVLPNVAEASYN